MNRIFHVAVTGCDRAEGSAEHPFRTSSKAAALAQAGDRVIVHEGEYREWVKPQNGGKSEICRITYEAAPGEKTVIKGSERITCWEPFKGTVWKATLPNSFSEIIILTPRRCGATGLFIRPNIRCIPAKSI